MMQTKRLVLKQTFWPKILVEISLSIDTKPLGFMVATA